MRGQPSESASPDSASDTPPVHVSEPVLCISCGYNLQGLRESGDCPECGTPVLRSLQGYLLVHSSPDYTARLHRGVFIILTAIIVQIIGTVAGAFAAFALAGAAVGSSRSFELVLGGFGMLAALAIMVGWWLLSSPDPSKQLVDRGERWRRIVRICIVISAAISAASFLFTSLLGSMSPATSSITFAVALGLTSTVLGVVTWVAQMLYIRWLAPRLPNARVFRRAKLLSWLGPVLNTIGIFLLGLGPLIALVMYWNMLDKVRKDLKAIRAEQATMA